MGFVFDLVWFGFIWLDGLIWGGGEKIETKCATGGRQNGEAAHPPLSGWSSVAACFRAILICEPSGYPSRGRLSGTAGR
jgi:hypothetical protein